jgi:hypothetical protein
VIQRLFNTHFASFSLLVGRFVVQFYTVDIDSLLRHKSQNHCGRKYMIELVGEEDDEEQVAKEYCD